MAEPNYKRPFAQEDFRGYFRWSQRLTRRLGGSLYHACHEDELREILDQRELGLRSKWSLRLPRHGLWEAPGLWTGLNYYNNGNRYGPLLIELPLSALDGRHFMAFRRKGSDRNRYFFVQYEARIPVYSFEPVGSQGKKTKPKTWRKVNVDTYFDTCGSSLSMKSGAIYDIVVTQPVALSGCRIRGVSHPKCIPQKCKGSNLRDSRTLAREIAVEQFQQWMQESAEYRRFLEQFPDVAGESIIFRDPDDL